MELRQESYEAAQEFMARFKQLHGGLECRNLLGVDISTAEGFQRFKEANLFGTRCSGLVRDAAWLLESFTVG
ncbi:hypothetical protein DFAR_860005 [Desulfarculales bacterium]